MLSTADSPVTYTLEVLDARAHLFRVRLEILEAQAQQEVSLPVWIPGSYLVREFSQHLSHMQCSTHNIAQIRKNAWRIACQTGEKISLQYQIYAFDTSVRSAYLDTQRGFFNGTSLFVRAQGLDHLPHTLEVTPYRNWRVACALTASSDYLFHAANYDELVDSPCEMGDFDSGSHWQGHFTAHGIAHRFVISHAGYQADYDRLLRDTQRICEAAIALWHPEYVAQLSAGKSADTLSDALKPAHTHYVFLLHCAAQGYGGLEHRNSTALLAPRSDLPPLDNPQTSEGYISLLGLISHEYFHTWCVKRLRPPEFTRYDYEQENYTTWLWLYEGFTSYYDDKLLLEAGLIDEPSYWALVSKNLNHSLQMPGANVQSVAEASYDAWMKYYRSTENTPNITVSYYTKGSVVALCMDMQLRQYSSNLDALMRHLWHQCWLGKSGAQQGVITDKDFHSALQALSGRSWHEDIDRWVHSTEVLPFEPLLEAQGLAIERKEAAINQTLGLRVSENENGIHITTVLRRSLAEQAGLCAGDTLWGVAATTPSSETMVPESAADTLSIGWRIHKLSELGTFMATSSSLYLYIVRDGRILRLRITTPKDAARVLLIHRPLLAQSPDLQ